MIKARYKMKKAAVLLSLALMLLLPVVSAEATITITFSGGAGGTIVLSAGGDASGTDIPIENMQVVRNAEGFNGNFTVAGGALNFDTSTGAISITGTVTIGETPVSGALLSGTITAHQFFGPGCPEACSGPNLLVVLEGFDQKLQELLTALGGEAATIGNDFDFFGPTTSNDFNGSTGTANSSSIANNSR